MFRPAETNAFRTKPQSVCRVFRRIRIGAYIQFAEGVGPFHDPFEIAADRGILGCDIAVRYIFTPGTAYSIFESILS